MDKVAKLTEDLRKLARDPRPFRNFRDEIVEETSKIKPSSAFHPEQLVRTVSVGAVGGGFLGGLLGHTPKSMVVGAALGAAAMPAIQWELFRSSRNNALEELEARKKDIQKLKKLQ